MVTRPARDWLAQAGPTRTSSEILAWCAFVALSSELVPCCDCQACQQAEAIAAARRLRALGEAPVSPR